MDVTSTDESLIPQPFFFLFTFFFSCARSSFLPFSFSFLSLSSFFLFISFLLVKPKANYLFRCH